MAGYISPEEITRTCGTCSRKTDKQARTSGKTYAYCEEYSLPCFKCIKACQDQASRDEDKALAAMEAGIYAGETAYGDD